MHFLHWSWKENWPTNMKKEAPKLCGEIAKIKILSIFSRPFLAPKIKICNNRNKPIMLHIKLFSCWLTTEKNDWGPIPPPLPALPILAFSDRFFTIRKKHLKVYWSDKKTFVIKVSVYKLIIFCSEIFFRLTFRWPPRSVFSIFAYLFFKLKKSTVLIYWSDKKVFVIKFQFTKLIIFCSKIFFVRPSGDRQDAYLVFLPQVFSRKRS